VKFLIFFILITSSYANDICQKIDNEQIDNKTYMLKLIAKNPRTIICASDRLKDDRDVVLKAITNNDFFGYLLKDASTRIKGDKEIVLKAVSGNGFALQYASLKLRDDYNVVLQATKSNWYALKFASPRLQDNYEIVKIAVQGDRVNISTEDGKTHFSALEFSSKRLQDNKEIVKLSVAIRPLSLQFASEKLKDDYDIVSFTLTDNFASLAAIQFASVRIQNDDTFIKKYLKKDPYFLKFVTQKFKDDKALVLPIISKTPEYFEYISPRLQNDENIVTNMVNKKPQLIKFASLNMRNNKKLMIDIVKTNPQLVRYASMELLKDKDIAIATIQSATSRYKSYECGSAIYYLDKSIFSNKEIFIELVKIDGMLLRFGSQKLRSDKDIIAVALKNNKKSEKYVFNNFKECKNLGNTEECVWEQYNVNDAIELFYGRHIELSQTSKLKIITSEVVGTNIEPIELKIKVEANLESIAIFQNRHLKKSLLAYYEINEQSSHHYFKLYIKGFKEYKDLVQNVEIVVVAKTKDGKYYLDKNLVKEVQVCDNGVDWRKERFNSLKKLSEKYATKLKISGKSDGNITQVKVLNYNLMMTKNEARILKKKENSTKQIIATVGNKKVLSAFFSENIAGGKAIKFLLKGIKPNELLTIKTINALGKSAQVSKIIKKGLNQKFEE